ncbi:ProQ/FINO family protein [Halomonas chromatireducens]|uniref:ProP effector n=1 Tax=Halomonas chromatireducens TaxID=507626 RepID=A0A120JVM3_9GAMM|nr:ProQ/FINO family protein [Halomonas chromatireducens]AMC99633.1 ProP effector [Halomonas chromatireducens]
MIDERSLRLLNDLEVSADATLGELHGCRVKIRQLQERVSELEAARLELEEENRELDEQNRELEEDNVRLRERLRKGEPSPMFPGPSRRAQGLAALIGHRPRDANPDEQGAPVHQHEPESPGGSAAPQDGDRQWQGEPRLGEQDKRAEKQEEQQEEQQEEKRAVEQAERTRDDVRANKEEQPKNVSDERQAQLPIEQAPSAEALLTEWYRRYPDTFFKGHTRPLKVGIHQDLAAREPWPEKLVRRALAGYVNLPRYLKAVREGAQRIDLAGQPDGSVDAQAAEHAHRKLERLQAERRKRGQAPGPGHRRGEKVARTAKGNRTSKRGTPGGEAPSGRPAAAAQPPSQASNAPSDSVTRADPEARLEAKLSALLAKHNGRDEGR